MSLRESLVKWWRGPERVVPGPWNVWLLHDDWINGDHLGVPRPRIVATAETRQGARDAAEIVRNFRENQKPKMYVAIVKGHDDFSYKDDIPLGVVELWRFARFGKGPRHWFPYRGDHGELNPP